MRKTFFSFFFLSPSYIFGSYRYMAPPNRVYRYVYVLRFWSFCVAEQMYALGLLLYFWSRIRLRLRSKNVIQCRGYGSLSVRILINCPHLIVIKEKCHQKIKKSSTLEQQDFCFVQVFRRFRMIVSFNPNPRSP